MRYPYILMDADQTLFDFRRAEAAALVQTLAAYGAPTDAEALDRYRQLNRFYWDKLERGEISKPVMLVQRFTDFFAQLALKVDSAQVNRDYLAALGSFAFLLPGAYDLCRRLVGLGHRLYIVTNGTAAAQATRFKASGLEPFFRDVFISEVIGAEKPSPRFFGHVFEAMGQPPRESVIILGDSLTSDMRGGRAAGITTCWYSPQGGLPNEDCDHVITTLDQLEAIVT